MFPVMRAGTKGMRERQSNGLNSKVVDLFIFS